MSKFAWDSKSEVTVDNPGQFYCIKYRWEEQGDAESGPRGVTYSVYGCKAESPEQALSRFETVIGDAEEMGAFVEYWTVEEYAEWAFAEQDCREQEEAMERDSARMLDHHGRNV